MLAEGGTEKLSDLPKVTQLVLKEINPESSLEGLMLKLKLQYFGHLVRRANSLEETLMLGKIESRERRGRQKMRWLDGITDSMNMNLKVEEEFEHTLGVVEEGEAWHAAVLGSQRGEYDLATEQQATATQPVVIKLGLELSGESSTSLRMEVGSLVSPRPSPPLCERRLEGWDHLEAESGC